MAVGAKFWVLAALAVAVLAAPGAGQQQLKGDIAAVEALLDRVLPGSRAHFEFSFSQHTLPTFTMEDLDDGRIFISGTSVSEMTAALGVYFREYCNMTIGWPRGGGSNVFLPTKWPILGQTVIQHRNTPWSYIMNVCTHSYSLVWYTWADWERFIDWMALSGINLALAMTGQEEVQYKVFTQLGLSDNDIRTWFNGPAFLTWSRGQNEYGNNIAGPLPRSWMKAQWDLQRLILARYRSLGIVGQLPGFQGNVPIALKGIFADANITQQGDTGWMHALDPLFARIADLWMKTLIEDFGTDHWYQLDGYFNGGTAPWYTKPARTHSSTAVQPHAEHLPITVAPVPAHPGPAARQFVSREALPVSASNPPCQWSGAIADTYLAGCAQECRSFATLAAAQAACAADSGCGGVTVPRGGRPELRAGGSPIASGTGETSYYITNEYACHNLPPDPQWMEIGAAAYAGLSRTDPQAIWSFQGWAIVGWHTALQASHFSGFVHSAPADKFVVIDMSVDGSGEWQQWNNASFFGGLSVWTTLHDFGGTDGMKGELAHINRIPFDANAKGVIGTGYTPEGIDQNPVYYEFMAQANFRTAPVDDLVAYTVTRAHRQYGLIAPNADVTAAWTLLSNSAYTEDISVQDHTGVAHLPGSDTTHFIDRRTPTPKLCLEYQAWGKLISVALSGAVPVTLEPFRYDLVNLGRDILAQISTPLSQNFSLAYSARRMDTDVVNQTGRLYIELLQDLDRLVASDTAFLLGPWIAAARSWAGNFTDCGVRTCGDFYEWNARVQLTTWNPTPAGAAKIPDGPIDYAGKHWAGLIADYYAVRAQLVLQQALTDGRAGRPLDQAVINKILATHAFQWTTATNPYPTLPTPALAVSQTLFAKYAPYFASCTADVQ